MLSAVRLVVHPRGVVAALALAALLLAGCDDGPPTPSASRSTPRPTATPRPPSDRDLLTRLVAARARALADGDARAYVATAIGAQARRDRRALAAARRLPLSRAELAARSVKVDGDRATLRVQLTYAFRGIDTHYLKSARLTARRTPDGWRIASDKPAAGTLAPWEHRAYTARRSTHFLALTPRGLKAPGLMADLERGYAKLRLPGVRPPRRVLVIVARDGADVRALTKDIDTDALTAVAETQFATRGRGQSVSSLWGERVFVLWDSYRSRPADRRQTVIAHELTHAALAKRTSARTPPWLYEGIAMYASGDNRSGDAGALLSGRGVLRVASAETAARRAMSLARLSSPLALQRLPTAGLAFAYAYSSAAAYTIAERYGPRALLRVLRAYGSDALTGSGRALTDKVLRRTLHVSLTRFQSQVDAYATAHSRF